MMKNNQGANQNQVVGTPTRIASSAQHAAASKKPSPMFYLDLNSPDRDHFVDSNGYRNGISLPVINTCGNAEHEVNNTQSTQAAHVAPPARVQFTVTSDSGYKRKLFVEEDEQMDTGAVSPPPMRFSSTSHVLRQRLQKRFPGGMPQLMAEFPGGLNQLQAQEPNLFRFSRKKPS